jgi:hypothetical protein
MFSQASAEKKAGAKMWVRLRFVPSNKDIRRDKVRVI